MNKSPWAMLSEENLMEQLSHADLVIDALFGTGLPRPLDESASFVVSKVNEERMRRGLFVVAVDIPSGLPSDGQRTNGVVVRADATVTFSGRKIAHIDEFGAPFCSTANEESVPNLGVLDESVAITSPAAFSPQHFVLDGPCPAKKPLLRNLHKGTFGRVGVVAGSAEMVGASILACR
ncbi:MAG: hypothetical protein GY822_08400 [Deltaproteobacteria bacterium]|nr:hypothetical protein [Deltaproteobacteria bacterium]